MNPPQNILHGKHAQDTKYLTQLKRVFVSFFNGAKTMKMVADETGIMRANICRHVHTLHKSGSIQLVNIGYCQCTKYLAGYYTTNPELFSKPSQLNLFD